MNFRLILRYIGYIVLMEGAFMIPAMLISLFCDERASWVAFLAAIILSVVIGFFLSRLRADDTMHAREGFATVALGWIVLSFFGALPFFFSGAIPALSTVGLKRSPALPPPAPVFCRRWRACRMGFCTGAALPTGWAVWACWFLLWR